MDKTKSKKNGVRQTTAAIDPIHEHVEEEGKH
jgi:hypothetical protein